MSILEYNRKKFRVDERGCVASQNDTDEDWELALSFGGWVSSLSIGQIELIEFIIDNFLDYSLPNVLNNVFRIALKTNDCIAKDLGTHKNIWKISSLQKRYKVNFFKLDGKFYMM